ncbi:MAG: GFA family protein [Gammaproteobacteria bacterium]|nr:GFA family protein [Gammaproteobacteria bacterium]MDH5653565.1 GFA family protein [Gammaproteobacteria bacterium]
MQRYTGTCHCGAVKFSFEHDTITKGLRCNCSICKRKGALMSTFVLAPDQINIEAGDDTLGLYKFGNKVAKHYFCKHCGIYPFHETFRIPGHYRVNLGCIDAVDIFALEVEVFDGKAL